MMAPIAGYESIEEVMGFNLSHWSRVSGGYSPRKAASPAMVVLGAPKKGGGAKTTTGAIEPNSLGT